MGGGVGSGRCGGRDSLLLTALAFDSTLFPPTSLLTIFSMLQNWYGQKEHDCLIKTKQTDVDYLQFTVCDFCPVL